MCGKGAFKYQIPNIWNKLWNIWELYGKELLLYLQYFQIFGNGMKRAWVIVQVSEGGPQNFQLIRGAFDITM